MKHLSIAVGDRFISPSTGNVFRVVAVGPGEKIKVTREGRPGAWDEGDVWPWLIGALDTMDRLPREEPRAPFTEATHGR